MIGKYAFANVQQLRSHLVDHHLFGCIKFDFWQKLKESDKSKCPVCKVECTSHMGLIEHFGDKHTISRHNVGQQMETQRKRHCPDCPFVTPTNSMEDMLRHCLVKHYQRLDPFLGKFINMPSALEPQKRTALLPKHVTPIYQMINKNTIMEVNKRDKLQVKDYHRTGGATMTYNPSVTNSQRPSLLLNSPQHHQMRPKVVNPITPTAVKDDPNVPPEQSYPPQAEASPKPPHERKSLLIPRTELLSDSEQPSPVSINKDKKNQPVSSPPPNIEPESNLTEPANNKGVVDQDNRDVKNNIVVVKSVEDGSGDAGSGLATDHKQALTAGEEMHKFLLYVTSRPTCMLCHQSVWIPSDNKENRLKKLMRHVYFEHLFSTVRKEMLDKISKPADRKSMSLCWQQGCPTKPKNPKLLSLAEHYAMYHKVYFSTFISNR